MLRNKKDLFNPIFNYWRDIKCKNIQLNDELNAVLNANKIITQYNKYIDNACYHSVIQYENIHLMLFFQTEREKAFDFYLTNCKHTHLLYGIKTMTLDRQTMIHILYQLQYQDIKNYDTLIEKIENDHKWINSNEMIKIQLFMLIKKNNYRGQNLTKESMIFSKDRDMKQLIASIFYCENSIEVCRDQNLRNILCEENNELIDQFQKIKTFLRSYSTQIQNKVMLYSSIVLFIYGLRVHNDIDMYIDTIDIKTRNSISQFLDEMNSVDYSIKNTQKWPSHWDIWLDAWATKCGAKYFEEIIGMQDYHFYFCGIKIIKLDVDIVRRLERKRPAACADLIMINEKLHKNIQIGVFPKVQVEYKKMIDLTENEIDDLHRSNAIYDEQQREFSIEKKIEKERFLKTTQKYLRDRYGTKFDINTIKSFFQSNGRRKIKIRKS